MSGQENKPNNETFISIGKPDRRNERNQEKQAQEFINETDQDEAAPSTAQGGKQTPVVKDKNSRA